MLRLDIPTFEEDDTDSAKGFFVRSSQTLLDILDIQGQIIFIGYSPVDLPFRTSAKAFTDPLTLDVIEKNVGMVQSI